jgi:hypothetical protein
MSGSGTLTPIAASTDSYVSVASAGAYFSGDPRATAFLALVSGMAWYLTRATKTIDAMPFAGLTYYIYNRNTTIDADEQALAFPRVIDGKVHDWDEDTGLPIVPQNVKDACCEEAIALYKFFADSDNTDRQAMKEQGVQIYNLGGVYSETLAASNPEKHNGLLSSEAYRLMKGYLGGAVELTFGSIAYSSDISTSTR